MAVCVVGNVVVHRHAWIPFCEDVEQLWESNRPRGTLIVHSFKLRFEARARTTSTVGKAASVALIHTAVVLPWLQTNAQNDV
eukprot:COSAG02_NODE_11039_length_1806_cov_6.877690_1_plen_81_part_10